MQLSRHATGGHVSPPRLELWPNSQVLEPPLLRPKPNIDNVLANAIGLGFMQSGRQTNGTEFP